MPVKKILKEHETSMKKCVEYLHNEFKGVRTGRASTGLVDNIKVEYYGSMTPINQMANVNAPDATNILIKPFDPSSLKNIEKAIKASDVGLNPIAENGAIRISVPPLSEERREKIADQVKQMGEAQKIAIRNVRRDANKKLDDDEKNKVISEDDRDHAKKEVDQMTKKYTEEIEEHTKAKIEEVMTV
ncbi:Vegetative protein 12B [Sedimentisphaera cyanobacteriorum]|uniref:Ribosome-recycling factor n=1 Tax=Sedimentisphaera cyanobacteriorum TaxID=1940790 RepID=A0A1Q2HMC8_9BACT|nr:ribosome recycling factor [Sedimentisphaera cyanobacteriorum]AQQ08366.1 Vegetative protein 12B [Sedimentisphaera cyanobacteriorum]